MMHRSIRVALMLVALAGALVGWLLATRPFERRSPAITARPPAPSHARLGADVRALDSVADATAARTPFRLSRTPAAVAYDPERGATPPPVIQLAPPKPTLSLAGIVWGAQPTAVVEGLPGIAMTLAVRQGDRIGALTIWRIRPDQVVINGMDTTWTLRLKTQWQ
jgi:hypothetical protein